MVFILTCSDCRKTSAVVLGLEKIEFPRIETWLFWACRRCNRNHRWLVPSGRSVIQTVRQSLNQSTAYGKSRKRKSIYTRLRGASPAERSKILFGELIWWWREEAGLNQNEAADRADITTRQLSRLEAGENKPHPENLKRIVHAVYGDMDQAYLVLGSKKSWENEFKKFIEDFEKDRISKHSGFQIDPEGWELEPGILPDVELALSQFRRVLPAEPHEDRFLLFAYVIYQSYWTRLLGGTITIDDSRTEIIPAVKKLLDMLDRCEDKKARHMIIYEMACGAEMFLTKPLIADLVTHFILHTFSSGAGVYEARRRIKEEWGRFVPMEKLLLTLFDLIKPERQLRLIEECQKLQRSPRQTDEWFKDDDRL